MEKALAEDYGGRYRGLLASSDPVLSWLGMDEVDWPLDILFHRQEP